MLASSEAAESPMTVLGCTMPHAIASVLLSLLGPAVVNVS
jgi:hypothetical protein